MQKHDLNQTGDLFTQGKISLKTTVNIVAQFITQNSPVFHLNKYDEDFRSEVVLRFLEKGEKIISSFNPELGSFFTFISYNIQSIILFQLKKASRTSLQDFCLYTNSISDYENLEHDYESINSYELNSPKSNYNISNYKLQLLQSEFKAIQNYNARIIIILLLKSSYFINDEEIKNYCSQINVSYDLLHNAIEYTRTFLSEKIQKNKKTEESRNHSYFYHKKYESQIQKAKNSFSNNYELDIAEIKEKYLHHTRLWNNKNQLIEKQLSRLSVSNKIIADILGICERQVRYYIESIKTHNTKFDISVSINLFNKKIRKNEQERNKDK